MKNQAPSTTRWSLSRSALTRAPKVGSWRNSHDGKWLGLGCVLALALGWSASVVSADHSRSNHYRYEYISLTDVPVPPGYAEFMPWAIDDSGRVYGHVGSLSGPIGRIAVYANGVLSVYQEGYPTAGAVNARGTLGGFVEDPQSGNIQAALFRRNQVELIPYLPGDTRTFVESVSDSNTVLVFSERFPSTQQIYKNGKAIFSYQLPEEGGGSTNWGINNEGTVSGDTYIPNLNATRAIRFRRPYGEPELLDPLPTDRDSSSLGINNSGNILGVSSNDLTTAHYGIWDRKGNFKPYIEGVCCNALFNDENLIVVTWDYIFNSDKSYLVPNPGVQLDIEDLLVNRSDLDTPLQNVVDINNRGDMIGLGPWNGSRFPAFLLRRVDRTEK